MPTTAPAAAGTAATVARMETPLPACQDCDWDSVPRVRFYLIVWRQSRIHHESFAEVLRHMTRDSRTLDPAFRGRSFDWDKARAIGWSLDEVARVHGLAFMHADNADAVCTVLCPSSAAR